MTRFSVLIPSILFTLILSSALLAQPASPLGDVSARTGLLLKDDITKQLIHTSSGDLAHDYVSRISLWDRSQVTDGYTRASEWVKQKAVEFGLQEVMIEKFTSDGKTEYFGNQTRPLWRARKAELWVTAPYTARVTSYAELPMSVAIFSETTHLEADVVYVGEGNKESDYATDVSGKIVLTTSHPNLVIQKAVQEKGAAGIVSSWSLPEWDMLNRMPGDFPDQVGWATLTRGDANTKGTFAFLISARRGQELKHVLDQGQSMKMKVDIESEVASGSLDVVSGVIRGSKYPDEEIILTAHLDHYKPGSSDNASGSASALEVVRTLNTLIAAGVLPPPLRTIRFLWVPEYSGTWAWFSEHLDDPVKRIANINFDMLGENLLTTNAVFAISYTPDSNPSFLNGLMTSIMEFMNAHNDDRYPPQKEFHIVSVMGSRNRLVGRMIPSTVGTDHEIFNNLGIPGAGPAGWPDNFYHSSEDSPDKVDPTQLHRVVFTGLAALSTMAYADNDHAVSIAEQTALYGKRRIAESEFMARQNLLSATAATFPGVDRASANRLRHVYGREEASVMTATVFARTPGVTDQIKKIASGFREQLTASESTRDVVALRRAATLHVRRDAERLSDAENRAAKLVPERLKGKELFNYQYVARILGRESDSGIEEVNKAVQVASQTLKNQGVDDLRLMGLPDAPAYYADGKRSILDIRNAFAAEYTNMPIESLIGYFRAYEIAGLMEVHEK